MLVVPEPKPERADRRGPDVRIMTRKGDERVGELGSETVGERPNHRIVERHLPCDAGGGDRRLVAFQVFGYRHDRGAGRREEGGELLEGPAVEHAARFRDALDLVEEPVALDAIGRILQRVLGEHDHEARRDARALAP